MSWFLQSLVSFFATTILINGTFLHQSGVSDVTSGLIGEWEFDETSSPAVDSIGSSNLTWQNDTTYVTGHISNAIDFDGTGDYAVESGTTVSNLVNDGDISLSFWLYADSIGWLQRPWGNVRFECEIQTDGSLDVTSDNFVTFASSATSAISATTWTHIVVLRKSTGDTSIYIDGSLSGSADQSTTVDTNAGFGFAVGTRGSATYRDLQGAVDRLRIYNRILSTAEISTLAAQ